MILKVNGTGKAVSKTGAEGVAQIHAWYCCRNFKVNPYDPASAIDGAARYLRYLIDYFKGDVKKAIYAYNGGMGNIERLGIGFNEENANYYPEVIKNSYKYGSKEIPVRPSIEPN